MILHTRGVLLFHISAVHESVRSEHFESHYSKLKLLSKNISVMFGYNIPFSTDIKMKHFTLQIQNTAHHVQHRGLFTEFV